MSSNETDTTDASGQSSSAEAESYPALQWRDEPPTEPGYYWMRDPRFENTEVIHEVYLEVPDEENLMVGQMNPTRVSELDPHWEWAGPIPEPREPEAESAG